MASQKRNLRPLLPLFVIVGVFIVIGAVLISSGILPEESAKQFHTLGNVTIQSGMKVIQQPTLQNNVFIYAINDVAERGIDIAQADPRVKQILDQAQNEKAAVTIAAVQPTVMVDSQSGQVMHSSGGQVIITANWQIIDGAPYLEPQTYDQIANKRIESHQQIWNVIVDVDKQQVTDISQQADRVITDTSRPNIVRTDMNMFIPNAIIIKQGSTIQWPNLSSLPHNVVGIFNQTSSSLSSSNNSKETGPNNNSKDNNKSVLGTNATTKTTSTLSIDSGFIQPNNSWQYHFDKIGVFNYICTIHSQEGMRGTIIVSPSSSSSS
jgi:plastocyanin